MKDGNDSDKLGVWNDPELEARLVAMLMGELSPYEEAEMEVGLERSPELRLFRDRMEEVLGLVSEVGQLVEDEADGDEWKMTGERRGDLLEKISGDEGGSVDEVVVATVGVQWRNVFSVAACLLISFGAFVMMFLRRGEVTRNQEEIVSYYSEVESEEELMKPVLGENAWAFSKREDESDIGGGVEIVGGSSVIVKPEMTDEVGAKPSSPGSSMARVIAANTPSPTSVPVPSVMVAEPSLDFGVGDDFGDGWGAESLGGGGGKELAFKTKDVGSKNERDEFAAWMSSGVAKNNSFGLNTNSTRHDAWSGALEKENLASNGTVTGGNRSGDYAITRDNIDGYLNNAVTGGVKANLAVRYSGGLDDSKSSGLGLLPENLDSLGEAKGRLFRSQVSDHQKELPKWDIKDQSQVTREKLADIELPLMEFDEEATVGDAVNFLRQRARELDSSGVEPSKKGLSFVFRDAAKSDDVFGDGDAVLGIGGADRIVDIKLGGLKIKDVPMDEALRQIAQQAGLRYKVEGGEVALLKATDVDDNEMYARTFRVPESMVDSLSVEDGAAMSGDPFGDDEVAAGERSVKDLLELQGIKFPEGATVGYSKERGTLTVRNTADGLEMMEELVDMVKKEEQSRVSSGFEIASASQALRRSGEAGEVKGKQVKKDDDVWAEAIPDEEERGVFGRKSNALAVGGKSDVDKAAESKYDARRLASIEEFKKKRREQEDKVEDHRTRLYALSKKLQIPYHGRNAMPTLHESDANEYATANQAYEEAKRAKVQLESFTGSLEGLDGEDLAVTLIASGRPEAAVLKTDFDELSELKNNKAVMLASGFFGGDDKVKSLDDSIKEVKGRLERGKANLKKKLKEDLVVFEQNVEKLRLDTAKEEGDLMVIAEEKTRFGKVREDYEREKAILDAIKGAEFNELLGENLDVAPQKKTQKAAPDFSKEVSAAVQTHSTFSLNVSDVSYQLAKSVLLEKGGMPGADKVRVEEFVNTFDYGDPSVSSGSGEKVNCVVEQCAHPFYQQRNLMRVGMKTGAIGRSQPLRLTVLLDNSGSMERADRKATVLKAVEALASQLGPEDEVTLLSFARGARLVAQKVRGNEAMKLVALVRGIPSEGGTNLSRSIEQAYASAKETVEEGAMSRIVLITDGAANLGNADPEELSKSVERMRQQGIAFDACGVGADGLDDDMLEALTRKGDGRYYFINKPEDADAGFAQKLAGALRPAAQNVKVQVVFNPERVGNYRLVGFEKHRLKKQDFRNDAVDAAEMAAEEAGNALYQVEAKPDGSGDVGTVFVRFRDMASGQMVERSWVIPYEANTPNVSSAEPSMQLAAVAGMLGERLKQGDETVIDLKQMRDVYSKLRGYFHADEEVQDLLRMCEKVIR